MPGRSTEAEGVFFLLCLAAVLGLMAAGGGEGAAFAGRREGGGGSGILARREIAEHGEGDFHLEEAFLGIDGDTAVVADVFVAA